MHQPNKEQKQLVTKQRKPARATGIKKMEEREEQSRTFIVSFWKV